VQKYKKVLQFARLAFGIVIANNKERMVLKKQRFTVSRKIPESKGVTFEKEIKLNTLL